MAFASFPSPASTIGSGLGRRLKAVLLIGAVSLGGIVLAGCQTVGPGAAEPGQGTVVSGPNGRSPRPDVRPVGATGPVATGSPRQGGYGGGGPLKVALLVPQSGSEKARGDALFDAAQMALFDSGRSDIQLIVEDTSGGAGSAARKALGDGAQIILGPIFSNEVSSVRAVAAQAGVPVFTFSSDSSVAGGGVYQMSFPMEEEIRTVVNYSASKGIGLYAVMSPGDTYAQRAEAIFERDVNATGGHIVTNANYSGGGDYASVMQLNNKDFDAIFIPGGNGGLRSIARLIKYGPPPPPPPPKPKPLTADQVKAGMQPPPPPPPPPPPQMAVLPAYTLLGTGLWDEPGNAGSGALAGGLFAAPDPSMHASFASRFNSAYGHRPPSIASLGYDGMSLAISLSGSGPIAASNITDPNGFNGVDGIFRFMTDGTIQRGLAVLQVNGGGFSPVQSAPSSFQSVGY